MSTQQLPEVWLRGPVENTPALLQPVAHALMQAKEEVNKLMEGFPNELLWIKPAGAASAGFHLLHLSGVLDRLITYAKGNSLSKEQLDYLKAEGDATQTEVTTISLVNAFGGQVNKTLEALQQVDEKKLTEFRGVGSAAAFNCDRVIVSFCRTYHEAPGTTYCYGKSGEEHMGIIISLPHFSFSSFSFASNRENK